MAPKKILSLSAVTTSPAPCTVAIITYKEAAGGDILVRINAHRMELGRSCTAKHREELIEDYLRDAPKQDGVIHIVFINGRPAIRV